MSESSGLHAPAKHREMLLDGATRRLPDAGRRLKLERTNETKRASGIGRRYGRIPAVTGAVKPHFGWRTTAPNPPCAATGRSGHSGSRAASGAIPSSIGRSADYCRPDRAWRPGICLPARNGMKATVGNAAVPRDAARALTASAAIAIAGVTCIIRPGCPLASRATPLLGSHVRAAISRRCPGASQAAHPPEAPG